MKNFREEQCREREVLKWGETRGVKRGGGFDVKRTSQCENHEDGQFQMKIGASRCSTENGGESKYNAERGTSRQNESGQEG